LPSTRDKGRSTGVVSGVVTVVGVVGVVAVVDTISVILVEASVAGAPAIKGGAVTTMRPSPIF